MPLFADRYEMGPAIGYGGMAEVRAGHDTRLERPVAIKVMRPEVAHQPLVRDRFESEARMAARLMHPNVVSVFDSGEQDGLPYMVMERLPGDTLHDRLTKGPMPEIEVRLLAAEILAALGTAHAAGILHRDIKPANVLATGTGHWKVTDFGIAKALEVDRGDATATGLVLGTPAYLAPERLYGSAATVASDIYSVGVVLYEALTGRRPYESGPAPGAERTVTDQGGAGATGVAGGWPGVVTGAPLVPVSTIRPGVDPHLAGAVERALARDPSDRFRSAADMAAAISGEGRAAAAEPTSVMAAGPATEVLGPVGAAETAVYQPMRGAIPARPPRPGRNPAAAALALLAGAAVLVAIIIAAVGLVGSSHGGSPATSRTTAASTTQATAPTTTTTVAPSTTTTTSSTTSTTSTTTTSTTTTSTSTTLLPVTVPGPGGGPAKPHH